jgi:hypothetical protein
MKILVDVNLPIFVIIDEVKNGNLTANDLTEEQLDSLPKDVRKLAIENA